MGILRKKAGFWLNDGAHYNPRTAVPVPPLLLDMLVFPWAAPALERLEQFERMDKSTQRPTASRFLRLILKLREVVLQDAAAMMIEHPAGQATHPLFQMNVFLDNISVIPLVCPSSPGHSHTTRVTYGYTG
jgi:Centromere DNA-binding protein complex CBF3 subunit, domain 2